MTAATVRWIHSIQAFVVVERRDELAVAERPVRAAQAGVGGAHDDADRDEQERRRDGRRGELLEAGHERAHSSPTAGSRARGDPSGGDAPSAAAWLPGRLLLAPARSAGRVRRPSSSAAAAARPASPVRPAARAPARPLRASADLTPGASDGDPRHPGHRQHAARSSAPNRLLFSFLDAATNLPAARRTERQVGLRPRPRPGQTQPRHGHRGDRSSGRSRTSAAMYVADVDLPDGRRPGGPSSRPRRRARPPETIRVAFDVQTTSPTRRRRRPGAGRPTRRRAPTSAATSRQISTDATPDPAFYETSVADALAAHKPFVLVFATPKFCQSAQCGPTLDRVKPVAAAPPAT